MAWETCWLTVRQKFMLDAFWKRLHSSSYLLQHPARARLHDLGDLLADGEAEVHVGRLFEAAAAHEAVLAVGRARHVRDAVLVVVCDALVAAAGTHTRSAPPSPRQAAELVSTRPATRPAVLCRDGCMHRCEWHPALVHRSAEPC